MAISEQVTFTEHQESDENYTESEGSDPVYDSDLDPSYIFHEDTRAKLSNLSIRKKSKSRYLILGCWILKKFDFGFDLNVSYTLILMLGCVVFAGLIIIWMTM